ncbi:MAG: hypothetical protein WAT79_14945 [Saprospiraceae bacterium]
MDQGLIFLSQPFIKHYVGSIFDLGQSEGFSDWHPEYSVREKLSFSDKRTYHLPDDGLGKSCELSIHKTELLPPSFLETIDVTKGPCRITSICHVESEGQVEKSKEYVVPDGVLPFQLCMDKFDLKQELYVTSLDYETSPVLEIFDRKKNGLLEQITCDAKIKKVHLGHYSPGFYELRLNNKNNEKFIATMIKMFPVFIVKNSIHTLEVEPALW